MPAYVYANGQYHALAGNKIAKDGALLTMADTDRIVVGGVAYPLGAATGASQTASAAALFHATTEPSTGNAFCVTPLGAGLKDGSSWANAAPGQDIHLLLLQCSSGDRIYFAEGDYTTDRVMEVPAGVSLYGGFRAADSYAWSGRNSFTNPTRFTMAAATAFPWATCASTNEGQAVDGFAVEGYDGTVVGNAGLPVRNLYVPSGRVEIKGDLEHARLENLAADITLGSAYASLQVFGCTGNVSANKILDSVFFGFAGAVNGGIVSGCVFANCTGGRMIRNGITINIVAYALSMRNCLFVNCTGLADANVRHGYISGSVYKASPHGSGLVFVNCRATSQIGGRDNCCFVNCEADIIESGTLSTIVNSKATTRIIVSGNSVAWNCEAPIISIGSCSAQSEYDADNVLTLGYDNSVARFTNTGFAPAKGVQDAGDCPNPMADPTGYAAWMAAFGDWHPLANSFLVGAGYTITSDIHTDLDGVARPDPPTIGCYEPVPANANA